MPFITIPKKCAPEKQITFDDILYGIKELAVHKKDTFDTRTIFRIETPKNLLDDVNFAKIVEQFLRFNEKYNTLINTEDKSKLYHSFKIPKRSGGLRQINAPTTPLMEALRELKIIFEDFMFATYHTSAFAYVKGRSTIDALKRHQGNKSKWFLKLDFHDFFGSTTKEFLQQQLKMIFPFNVLYEKSWEKPLETALSLCFLNGGLPQGTPISPMLTNLMMIPIDHALSKHLREHSPHLVYTRYADDLLISGDLKFDYKQVCDEIKGVLDKFNAPFSLNDKKTRFGSSAGSNWNLGLMLNKDNNITVGNKIKKRFKVKLYCFLNDFKNGTPWELEDVQEFAGVLSYYKMVEKEYFNKVIKTYNEKFNIDTELVLKQLLSGN